MLYDPVERHLAVEKSVTREGIDGQEKKYYRIRQAKWYGGIVTADCVGCGLLCKFCWVSDNVMLRPADVGRFYSSRKIADSIIALAKSRNLNLLRISGGEPTLGKLHLLKLLENLQGTGYRFVLETNGIAVACDNSYAVDLSKYSFAHVRVSLKGCNEEEFSLLTGAKSYGFTLQLKALQRLIDAGVSCHASVMASFSPRESLQQLLHRLKQTNAGLAEELEVEELILYPHVLKRVTMHKLKYCTAH